MDEIEKRKMRCDDLSREIMNENGNGGSILYLWAFGKWIKMPLNEEEKIEYGEE